MRKRKNKKERKKEGKEWERERKIVLLEQT